MPEEGEPAGLPEEQCRSVGERHRHRGKSTLGRTPMHRAITTASVLALACGSTGNGGGGDCDAPQTLYADEDGDGHGIADDRYDGCDPPVAYVASDDDCDDGDASRFPTATERCNTVDDDCDGLVDDDDPSVKGDLLAYPDRDGDGFGTDPGVLFCAVPSGFVSIADDCDDDAADTHPGAREACGDAIDQDCDDAAPACRLDGDVTLDAADVSIAADPFSAYDDFGEAMTALRSSAALVVAAPGDSWSDAVFVFEALGPGAYDEDDASATLTRDDPYRSLGAALAAGEIDGDGHDDLVVAAPLVWGSAKPWTDEVYVELGPVTTHVIGGTVVSGDAGFVGAVSVIGDFDGDGFGEVAVGSPGMSGYGSATIFFGASLSGSLDDDDADVTMTASSDSADGLGASLGHADVDGDGLADLLLGAPAGSGSVNGTGAAYVILGSAAPDDAPTLPADADVAFLGTDQYDAFGAALGAGDLDADGLAEDVWIGSPGSERAYLFLRPSGTVAASDADGFLGGKSAASFGSSGDLSGDVDGDGSPDLLIGDPEYGSYAGAAYLFPTPATATPSASLFGAGKYTWGANALASVDLGADGYDDVFVGSPGCAASGAHGCVAGFAGGP
jgi:hypothetical protein